MSSEKNQLILCLDDLKKSSYMKRLMKIKSLLSLLFLVLPFSFMACNKDENLNASGNTENELQGKIENEFQGNVIIVGAGASGLAAAKKLEEEGISYQILEATDKLGGRIQKNENFADFPIDLGAEWIHEDKSILNYLIDQPGNEPNVETISYQPMNVQQVVDDLIVTNSKSRNGRLLCRLYKRI